MKLIKKCPNCGASLSFGPNDTDVTCEYCNQSFYIERDIHNNQNEIDIDENVYNLVLKPVVKTISVFNIIIVIFVFIFLILSLVFMHKIFFSNVFINKDVNTNSESTINSTNENSLTEISQINDESLQSINQQSLNLLESKKNLSSSYEVIEDWERAGIYLLLPKDTGFIALYDVYKITYKNGDTNVTLYASVEYNAVDYENGHITTSIDGYVSAPAYYIDKNKEYVYGYDSLESYYNKNLKSKKGIYEIKASDGLYIE